MLGTDVRFTNSFIQSLNRAERHVLMLHYAEELTIDEISQVLDLPAPRVEAILESLRERTRAALQHLSAA